MNTGSNPIVTELPGEADPGAYGLTTGDGAPIQPNCGIFPIVRYDKENRIHLLGTGFFITMNGLFVTAKHVLKDPLDPQGNQLYPISIIQFLPEGGFLQRPIPRCTFHKRADIAVGVAAPMHRNGNPLTNHVLTLNREPPPLGTKIVTCAYPKHLNLI